MLEKLAGSAFGIPSSSMIPYNRRRKGILFFRFENVNGQLAAIDFLVG